MVQEDQGRQIARSLQGADQIPPFGLGYQNSGGQSFFFQDALEKMSPGQFLPRGVGCIQLNIEPLAKLLKARGNGHSGQAKRDPESRIFKQFWIPAFAGMTD